MPKTKDAFAFRDLFEKILAYESQRLNVDKFIYPAELWESPLDYYMRKYFERTTGKQLPVDYCDKITARNRLIWGKEYRKRVRDITTLIQKHIAILQSYSGAILHKMLELDVFGLVALDAGDFINKLKSKGRRVNTLIIDYKWILEVFNSYDEVVSSEWKQLYLNEFGQRLKQARRNKKMTQEQLAEKLGMSRVGYAHYELSNRDPSLTMLVNLSEILDVPIEWLCGVKDSCT